MAEYNINKIKLPNGDIVKLVDETSGYTKNTGTVTSVGLQNGGGLAISGSPVTTSGTITVGHSNSITAQNTQGVYPVTIDANGHIASYGAKEDLLKVFTFESADGTPVSDFNTVLVLVYNDAADIANLTEINSIFDTKKVAIQFISTITGFEHTVMAFGTGERFNIDATDAGMGVLSNNMMFSFSGDYGDETSIVGYIMSDTSRLYSGTLIVIPSLNAIMVRGTRIDTNNYLSKNSVLTLEDYGIGTSKPIQVTPDTDISQITISHTALNSSGEKDTQAVYPITVDVGGHITSVGNAITIPTAGTTATAVSTTASGGSASTYSKSDHVHSISDTTITSALGFTPASSTHTHGNIANGGTISSTAVTPTNGDYILISDSSGSDKIERGIKIGTGTTKYLREDGTWQTVTSGVSDVKINNTSILSSGVANIVTNTAYNSSTNKIATMSDATKVKLTSVSNNSEYPLILGPTSITSGNSYEANYNSSVTVNSYLQQITLKKVKLIYDDDINATLSVTGAGGTSTNNTPYVTFYSLKGNFGDTSNHNVHLKGIAAPDSDYDAANKKYVDEKVASGDTKVTNTLGTTTKYYVTGTTSSSTNTGTQYFDTGIYATTTAGQLNATTYLVNEKTRLEYNSTTNSLDFIFI